MATNRRNHYRLLHVQPDAPPEVIKAAYRALMGLHHPDKGGEHATAVLLNEAYAVIGDATRRAAYDAARAARAARAAGPEQQPAPTAPPRPKGRSCRFCHFAAPVPVRASSRCTRCKAPLAPAEPAVGSAGRPNERRAMPRVSKSDWAVLYLDWQSAGIDVRMRDLSLDGISVFCGLEVPPGRTVRIVGGSFDVVADVVTCRRSANVFSLHAHLATAHFAARAGGFVSTTA